jgi:hypothetical protein
MGPGVRRDDGKVICPTGKSTTPLQFLCPAPGEKIFRFTRRANQIYNFRRPIPREGRIAIVTDAGLDAMDAGAPLTNGADADGEVVWS